MKATVVSIESGAKFVDKQRRITLRFPEADMMFSEVRFAENKLPASMLGAELDYEVEVTLEPFRGVIAKEYKCQECGRRYTGGAAESVGFACEDCQVVLEAQ